MENLINEAFFYLYKIYKRDLSLLIHSVDVYYLAKAIYNNMPDSFQEKVDFNKLYVAALLHDIGKKLLPYDLLNKARPLNGFEKKILSHHTNIGYDMLNKTIFEEAADCVLYHHERVDGTGYFSLPKAKIPIESMIIAVADTFSALTLKRVYRKPSGIKGAAVILNSVSGSQLDSEIVSVFCKYIKKQSPIIRRLRIFSLICPLFLRACFYKEGNFLDKSCCR